MSYQNLIMYFKTIPSYDSDSDEDKKTDEKKSGEDVEFEDLGNWITKNRAKNSSKRKR